MKKILLTLFVLSAVFAYSQAGVCGQFHRKYCGVESKHGGDGNWTYNAQSRSGLFNQGMTSKIRCVIYKGMDYRMNVCVETSALGDKVNYKIFDAKTNELLYDNSTAKSEPTFEFQSTATRQLIIEVTVPKGSTEKDAHKPSEAACVGLLIEHKTTDKQGFSAY
jgi:hypothetical protein